MEYNSDIFNPITGFMLFPAGVIAAAIWAFSSFEGFTNFFSGSGIFFVIIDLLFIWLFLSGIQKLKITNKEIIYSRFLKKTIKIKFSEITDIKTGQRSGLYREYDPKNFEKWRLINFPSFVGYYASVGLEIFSKNESSKIFIPECMFSYNWFKIKEEIENKSKKKITKY